MPNGREIFIRYVWKFRGVERNFFACRTFERDLVLKDLLFSGLRAYLCPPCFLDRSFNYYSNNSR